MKAFLSSTYIDLIEHRKSAVDTLKRMGQDVGQMEVFGARPEEPLKACLSEIEACDIFIGIYAHRYGYQLPQSQISITETEYDYATEHKKPIFCFMVDENFAWPPKMIEEHPAKLKLQNFKQRISAAVVWDTFTSPEVLGLKIATSVGSYIGKKSQKDGVAQDSAPPDLSSLAGRAISQTMAMVFVDLMRLLYVRSGTLAYNANAGRYTAFIEIADQHFGDLRSRIATYSLALDTKSHEEINQMELRLSWMLGRLKSQPNPAVSHEAYFQKMRKIGEALRRFCDANVSEQYQNCHQNAEAQIESILKRYPLDLSSPDETWQLRLETQTQLLKAMPTSDGVQILTIHDDMDQNLAVLYFAIDYLLLTMRAGK